MGAQDTEKTLMSFLSVSGCRGSWGVENLDGRGSLSIGRGGAYERSGDPPPVPLQNSSFFPMPSIGALAGNRFVDQTPWITVRELCNHEGVLEAGVCVV